MESCKDEFKTIDGADEDGFHAVDRCHSVETRGVSTVLRAHMGTSTCLCYVAYN